MPVLLRRSTHRTERSWYARAGDGILVIYCRGGASIAMMAPGEPGERGLGLRFTVRSSALSKPRWLRYLLRWASPAVLPLPLTYSSQGNSDGPASHSCSVPTSLQESLPGFHFCAFGGCEHPEQMLIRGKRI